MESNKFR
jgi:hypothetical protein